LSNTSAENSQQQPSAWAHNLRGLAELTSFPKRGRIGKIKDTRELVFTPLSYIAVYRLKDDVVELFRVLHGAQRWP
jgi:toxin ParE1/3/4